MKIATKLFFAFLCIECLIYFGIIEITDPQVAQYQQEFVSFIKIVIVVFTGLILEIV